MQTLFLLIKNKNEKILVKISATGKDSHTPVILKTLYKINIKGIINIKPLNIDIINAGFTLSLAEKYTQVIILYPTNINAVKYIRSPLTDILCNSSTLSLLKI